MTRTRSGPAPWLISQSASARVSATSRSAERYSSRKAGEVQPSGRWCRSGVKTNGTPVDEVILLLVANTLDQEPEPIGAIAGDHGDDIDREPGGNLREQPARVL